MRYHGLEGENLKNLETIVKFCISAYFKLFFEIKVQHHIKYAPQHILSALKLLKDQTPQVRAIITPVVERGAYHAHSESVLLSLLSSELREDRSFAVDKIIQLRNGSEYGDLSVRRRTTPSINLEAETLKELIDWNDKIHKPVFTCKLNLTELEEIKNTPINVPAFTQHTQSCERAVQEVAKASKEVHGEVRRDGWVRARIAHREFMPVFASKKDIMKM